MIKLCSGVSIFIPFYINLLVMSLVIKLLILTLTSAEVPRMILLFGADIKPTIDCRMYYLFADMSF